MKVIEVIADRRHAERIAAIAQANAAQSFRLGPDTAGSTQPMRLLVRDDALQAVLDALQSALAADDSARIYLIAVEVALPKRTHEERRKEGGALAAREALYQEADRSARLDRNYLVLVVLSTVVAAIGMVENNVAVIIGAMVIAPLLGPNTAFGLGTALGDLGLMRRSSMALGAGIGVAIALGTVIGVLWPSEELTPELMSRTDVGLDSVALALASGAAAALSLTTGLSSVLVGVMVAVALLPPAAALGLMIGHGRVELAAGAGLLLAVNIVCVNLATKLVLLAKGIAPRTWWEQQRAKKAMRIYLSIWAVTLLLLIVAIELRGRLEG